MGRNWKKGFFLDLCPQKDPNLVIDKTQHGYDEASIIISHIPLLGLSVVWYHLELDDASNKRESYANGITDDLWNSVKMDCKKQSCIYRLYKR